MAKEKVAAPETESYGQLVEKLEAVVRRLEAGELPLEQSLTEFEEGIRLVRRGEKLLSEAERRVEQLLEEGGQDRAAPLDVAQAPTRSPVSVSPSTKQGSPTSKDEEDVPF